MQLYWWQPQWFKIAFCKGCQQKQWQSDSSSQTSSDVVKNQSNQLNEGKKKDTDLGEEILIQNFWEKQTLQANANPISTKFASAATSFRKNESANDQV